MVKLMSEQERFLAGAFLKVTTDEDLTSIQGRVFLLIEATSGDAALDIRSQLAKESYMWDELLKTMRPWPSEFVTIDNKRLNECTAIKDFFNLKNSD
jgi:hypothetical protein